MGNYDKVFKGTAFTSRSVTEIDILKDHLFCIDKEGMIEKVVSPENTEYKKILSAFAGTEKFKVLDDGQYFLPGFVDLHVHAPQWAQAGTSLDLPLYDWLNTYTFPTESKFSDIEFAKEVYNELVSTLVANGTTTALYFATVHKYWSSIFGGILSHI